MRKTPGLVEQEGRVTPPALFRWLNRALPPVNERLLNVSQVTNFIIIEAPLITERVALEDVHVREEPLELICCKYIEKYQVSIETDKTVA